MEGASAVGKLDERADGLWERVEGFPDEEAVQRMEL